LQSAPGLAVGTLQFPKRLQATAEISAAWPRDRRAQCRPSISIRRLAMPEPATDSSLPRVVVVEDHPVCLLLLEDQLKGIGGCEVTACANAAEALGALARAPAALLLTDINLPGIDGLALARMIRAGKAGQANPRLAIVVITATAGPKERLACNAAGVDMVLVKPVSFETLGAVVRRYLGATPRAQADAATCSGPASAPLVRPRA